MKASRFCCSAAPTLLAVLVGCNPPLPPPVPSGELSGMVVLDDQIVKIGRIRVINDNGHSAEGLITPAGKYVIANAPVGPVKIVYVHSPKSRSTPQPEGVEVPPDAVPKKKRNPRVEEALSTLPAIPARYFDAASTPLMTVVGEGKTTFNIKMTTTDDEN